MYCEKCGKWSGKYPLCKECYYDTAEEIFEDDENENDEDLICPICGEPTNIYFGNARSDLLCRKHGMLANKGEIVQCPDCGKWNKNEEVCPCKTAISKPNIEETPKETSTEPIIIDKVIRCITCGYETDGRLFCKRCYNKYKEKEILIKIKNCKEIVPLDDFYEGYYECDDGHVVKSMAERDIDDYLFSQNIKHGYEIPLKLEDENGKTITLHPDFCIFDEKSKPLYYIEYWGYDDTNRDYTKTKKFKMPLYKKSGITLINIHAKTDLRNLKSNLQYKLEKFKFGIVNFETE